MQRDTSRARGTDFKGADISSVNIGTVVSLVNDAGNTYEITVLGAWDSDPDKQWVSYLSEAGAGLLNAKVGDEVKLRDHDTGQNKSWKITKIAAYAP